MRLISFASLCVTLFSAIAVPNVATSIAVAPTVAADSFANARRVMVNFPITPPPSRCLADSAEAGVYVDLPP